MGMLNKHEQADKQRHRRRRNSIQQTKSKNKTALGEQTPEYRGWVCKTKKNRPLRTDKGGTDKAYNKKTAKNKTALGEQSPGNMEGSAKPKGTGRSDKTKEVQEQHTTNKKQK